MKKRNTIQRQLVLDAVEALGCHPTADQVYSYILKIYPDISKGTVYRNLTVLSDERKIRRISVIDGADRFDHHTHAHYHISCTHCGAFCDNELPYVPVINEQTRTMTGFAGVEHDILFKGVCPQCAAASAGAASAANAASAADAASGERAALG